MLFIGLLIIFLNLFSLSGAVAETISRSPRDSDYFLFIGIVSLCLGVIGFSNYLTLADHQYLKYFQLNSLSLNSKINILELCNFLVILN